MQQQRRQSTTAVTCKGCHRRSTPSSSVHWHRSKRPNPCRRTIIVLLLALILTIAAAIDGGSSLQKSYDLDRMIRCQQKRRRASFVCCLQKISCFKAIQYQFITRHSAFQSPIHPTRSALVLGFWLNDHDHTETGRESLKPQIVRVDYKQTDDEGESLYLPERPEEGLAMYCTNQSAIDGINGIMFEDAPSNITLGNSLRGRLASRLWPLIVPLWLLPFLSRLRECENLSQIDDSLVKYANSSVSLVLPASGDMAVASADAIPTNSVSESSLALLPSQVILGHNASAVDADSISVDSLSESSPEICKDERKEVVSEAKQSSSVQLSNGQLSSELQETNRTRRCFFTRKLRETTDTTKLVINKEEARCPIIVSNIHELREAVLVNKIPLRDVGFRFPVNGIGSEVVLPIPVVNNVTVRSAISMYVSNDSAEEEQEAPIKSESVFQRHDPVINGTLSSLLSYAEVSGRNATEYRHGIELLTHHPVLELVKQRVITNSTPGNRSPTEASSGSDQPHLALVIEGGGMRGAVSAGMAAALSTLDLLDAFDSVHGSSAGAIVGAYLVSRQLCTDVYTDIMPAAGSRFASKRRAALGVGVDWFGDLIKRKLTDEETESNETNQSNAVCELVDDVPDVDIDGSVGNASAWICEDGTHMSSVELAMGTLRQKQRHTTWADDHHEELLLESMEYLTSRTYSFAQSTISKPLAFVSFGVGKALRPALSALDFAASMRHFLRPKPAMNLTYVLDGIMDETHGLRPFDVQAFKANDKKQPLYVIASTVSKGGAGEMETVAFNSAEGDFFGLTQDRQSGASVDGIANASWYGRLWNIVKKASSTVYSIIYKTLFTEQVEYAEPILPPGTNAIGGLVNNQKVISAPEQQPRKSFHEPTGRIGNKGKTGIFLCLEASMLVPGAAGPPIHLLRSNNRKFIEPNRKFPRFVPRRQGVSALIDKQRPFSHVCYDAFCYEPIPYRSAVEKAGATHVLALRSRPDGCVVETKQHLYERVVGPIYFRKHGMNNVAKLFSSGGSQYRYIEDVLTLNEGLAHGVSIGRNETKSLHPHGVKVPPTQILFGNDQTPPISSNDIDEWKRAHLLPITLPIGTPELPTLTMDKDEVLKAVRHGYAAAFDVLAPIAGLPFDSKSIPGERVAEILFPGGDDDIDILRKPIKIKPSYIGNAKNEEVIKELRKRERFAAWVTRKRESKRKAQEEVASHPQGALAHKIQRRAAGYHESDQYVGDRDNTLEWLETEALLAALPGFRNGKLDHIAESLLANQERKKEK